MPTSHVLAEFKNFRQADVAQLLRHLVSGKPDLCAPSGHEPGYEQGASGNIRCRQVKPELKSTPDRPIKKFGVVSCGHSDDVAWELIELHQQE